MIKNRFISIISVVAMMVTCFPILPVAPAYAAEQAKMADSVVDAIGVNTHLYYNNVYSTGYSSIIKPKLIELGVRHIRDGNAVGNTTYDTRLKDLAANGIKALLYNDLRWNMATSWTAAKDHIKSLNTDASKPVEMVEGPNEYDSTGSGWETNLRTQTIDIWNTYKNDSGTSSIPIVGPSLANTKYSPGILASTDANLTNYMQYGNLHSYSGGKYVEGSGGGGWNISLDQAITEYKKVSGSSDPLIASETGYHNAVNGGNPGHFGVSEKAAAKYLPRQALYYLQKGFTRLYFYEFINEGTDATEMEQNFGLLKNDGTPKWQYTSLKNMITILKDPGSSFATGSLNYTLTGDTNNIQKLLLQKRDGTFYLVLWQGVSSYNDASKTDIDPPARALTLTIGSNASSIDTYLPLNSASVVNSYTNTSSVSLSVPDHLLIVKIAGVSSQ